MKQKKNHLLLLSFLVPVVVMLGIFAGKGIFPFGDNSFLRTDMYHQYMPFFAELRHKLTGGGSLAYSFNIGMGTNFLSLFGYYLACPLNFLLIFCPEAYLIEFISYLVVFKIGLCGLTFCYYLSKRHNTKDFGMIFFSTFYALSGFMAAYSWNIMWLDCILLAPLVLLGLERLVNEGKCYLYCITLALAILSNYYIAMMLCMFLVLYFLVLLVCQPAGSNYMKKIFNFALYSLIAGALAACILLPEIYALKMTASAKSTFPKELKSYFPIFDMMGRHLINVDCEIGLDHWPNIYCGVAVFMMAALYVANKTVSYKEKIAKFSLLFFLLVSFSFNIPNFIWHGFHYPNSLPSRQSFLYIAILLSMGYEGYRYLKNASVKLIVGSFWGSALFILLSEKLMGGNKGMSYHVFYVSLLFVALYALCMYLYKKEILKPKSIAFFALILVVIESALNTAVTSVTLTSRSAYLKNTNDFQTLIEQVREEDPDFYRFEKARLKTKNDGAWVGYPSASVFSSTANANLTDLYKKLGMESSVNAYSFTGGTPFIASIFDIRYILSDKELPETSLMSLKDTSGNAYLYENNYTLPLGFMVPSDFESQWSLTSGTVAAQNSFIEAAAGTGDVLTSIPHTENGSTVTINPTESGYLFVKVLSNDVKDVTADIGDSTKKFDHVNRGYLLDLGYCTPDDEIILTAKNDKEMRAEAYKINEEAIAAFVTALNDEPLTLTSYSDTAIKGEVTALTDGLLFTSIPYDEGWSLYVDGVPTNIQLCGNALISVPLTAGAHTIELNYTVKGFKNGLLITINALVLLLLIEAIRRFLQHKNDDEPDDSEAKNIEKLADERSARRDALIRKRKEQTSNHSEDILDEADENASEDILDEDAFDTEILDEADDTINDIEEPEDLEK